MVNRIAQFEGRIAKITGPARSGKTEALVRRCAHLLARGVDPETILVVVSSGMAADAFKARLAKRGVAPAVVDEVVVCRAVNVCSDILARPAAIAATGRFPRVLNDDEYKFLLEDLKTLGQKNQRLHNMLLFFFAQWSNCEDEDTWLIPGEESIVLGHARMILTATRSMLRHELPYLCAKFLESEAGRPLAQCYDYVLCDDFQNLSHAEQKCVAMCALKQLIVAGDAGEATSVNTPYPFAKGFEKFERLYRGVDVFTLEETHGIEEALSIECDLAGTDAPERRFDVRDSARFVLWQTPGDELYHLADLVGDYLARNSQATASDVMIAVPSKYWASRCERALAQRGVKSSCAGVNPKMGGDLREAGCHGAMTAYVKLCLAADNRDAVAWRAWTGFDNAIANSEIWASLYRIAEDTGRDVYDTLASAVQGETGGHEVLKLEALKKAWRSGCEVSEELRDLKGMELASRAGLSQCRVFGEIVQAITGDEDAGELMDMVRSYFESPVFPDDKNTVRIALYENTCGLECPCLIMPGMVDGMIPFRDAFEVTKSDAEKARVIANDTARLRCVIGKGTEELVASTIAASDIETAETAKMRIMRVYADNGRRTALLKPSMLLENLPSIEVRFTEPHPSDDRALERAC